MLLNSKKNAPQIQPQQVEKPAMTCPVATSHREAYSDPQLEAAKTVGYLPGIGSCITREE